MQKIDTESLADMELTLLWQDDQANHREVYDASNVNFWRDILPRTLYEQLMGLSGEDEVALTFEAGPELVGYHSRSLFKINRNQFLFNSNTSANRAARLGRFYPKGILSGVSGVFPQNQEPFRCVGAQNGHLLVDFNHPLINRPLTLNTRIKTVRPKVYERGGTSIDWIEVLTNGPGMQSRWRQQPTDFFAPDAYQRADQTPDSFFYSEPRLVHHIDITARKVITDLYGKLIPQGARVLDLMSSWRSHLPEGAAFDKVVGLGLNREELDQNPVLDERVVHDLNQNPILPFESASFESVICSASIEYLTDPFTVFKEVSRVLVPKGIFIVTFSNRWFAPKAINVWSYLHEFERMGLVMEYFLKNEKFHDLNTFSRRGLPRDQEDKYYGELLMADPVYAVWGYR